jgi:tetratricopeptide (TPR) repeat protein
VFFILSKKDIFISKYLDPMSRLLLFLFLCTISISSVAQVNNPTVASLLRELKNNNLPDSTRILSLIQLTKAVAEEQPATAMQYAAEALQLSLRTGWDKGIANARLTKSVVSYMQADYANALDCLLKVMDTKEFTRDKTLEDKTYINLATLYRDLKQYDKSLEYSAKVLKLAEAAGDKNTQALILCTRGNVYEEKQKYDSARLCYQQSLAIAEQMENNFITYTNLYAIGTLLKREKKYREAINYFEKSASIANAPGGEYVLAPTLNNLASTYLILKDYQQAEQFSEASLQVAEKINAVKWQSEAWETLYTLYKERKEDDKAAAAYKRYVALRDSAISESKKPGNL